ncbi:hypothetical protein GDO86_003090 [Hymenochirus boettgeri]|uniref:Uncharacterized protein n=1 Tax=Hymenochirus boettgeri TaxID=247094 RepID=A0A8T2K2Q4_9PIPI|nr:hypothetical protein GDO86_003090 [Hymenochirus boettgeri]
MGTKQTKVCQTSGEGDSSRQVPGSRKSGTATKERGDWWAPSMGLRSGDKVGKSHHLPPYHRRVRMVQDVMALARQGRQEEATELLRHLRQKLVIACFLKTHRILCGHPH